MTRSTHLLTSAPVTPDRLRRQLAEEIAAAGLPLGPGGEAVVTDGDLAHLPTVVRRYLRFMGVVGRPRVWSFRARCDGRFRLRPRLGWMPAKAWQYNTRPEVARVFVMRLRLAGIVPMVGSDTYLRGKGRMLGKLPGGKVVADGQGEEFDIGELTTYLNDALLLAPAMLLDLTTSWSAVDDGSFDVALTDRGRTVRGRVFVDDQGAPYDFSTTDRFIDLPAGPTRAEWRTPIHEWGVVDGRAAPVRIEAVWHMPDGPLPYFAGQLTHITHNVRADHA